MSQNSKVAWTEGMFIRPQHFQQQDRYVEYITRARFDAVHSYGFGFQQINVDSSLLSVGKVGLEQCQGIFPEGTLFDCPAEHALPTPLSIPEGCANQIIYLALPLRQRGIPEVVSSSHPHPLARYALHESAVFDETSLSMDAAPIGLAQLRPQLILGRENADPFSLLPVARLIERLSDGKVILDEDFIPPCVSCHASPKLAAFMAEAAALLEQRSQTLMDRIGDINRSAGVNAIADFLLLQLTQRFVPVLHHFSRKSLVHPEEFYILLIELLGSLNAFQKNSPHAERSASYSHDRLQETFYPLMHDLREKLLHVIEPMAQLIPLKTEDFGITVGIVHDKSLLEHSNVILAIDSDVPMETLLNRFSTQIKIGSTESIHQLINLQLPGIALRLLPVAPIQIPFNAQMSYFQLIQQGALWEHIKETGGIAIHTSGELLRLKFELWIMRG